MNTYETGFEELLLASTLFSEGQGIRYDLKISFSQGQLPLLLGTFSTRTSQCDEEERALRCTIYS